MQNKITVPFDPDGNLPLYEQIYRYIRDEIKTGHLAEGDKLPSTRRLSDHLQVSRTTVDTAYDQLLSEQNSKPHAVLSLQLIPAVTHIENIYHCSRCGAKQ